MPENPEDSFKETEDKLRRRLKELGVQPVDSIPFDDPRSGDVRKAFDAYRADLEKIHRECSPTPEPQDLVDTLLEECARERESIYAHLARTPPHEVNWDVLVERLWARMEEIVMERGGTRPKRPAVTNVSQTYEAVNTVVRWCEERGPGILVSLADVERIAAGFIKAKTIQNHLSRLRKSGQSVPEPTVKGKGRTPHQYLYVAIRPFLVDEFPYLDEHLPPSEIDAKSLLDG